MMQRYFSKIIKCHNFVLFTRFLCVLCVLCGSNVLSKAQTKAVWIRPFINANETIRGDQQKATQYIRNELERMKRAGFDTIFVESLWDGYMARREMTEKILTFYKCILTKQRELV
jgi:hypothetical protein